VKIFRRIVAVVALLAIAVKGALSFLSWLSKQDEGENLWAEDEEFEESF
jgi:hypothetical protein